ncbi:acid--CoA ligase [alpha proteobacterium AAP38]|nr:acid--CoA ligase [alpha proteobacterium AAP38]
MEEVATGRTVTYAGLDERAARAAGLLLSLGVAEGDRVAILCRNRIEFFEMLFACAKMGAILVPLNWRMPAAEIRPLLTDSAPRVLFFGDEDAGVAADLSGDVPLRVGLDADYAQRRDATSAHAGRRLWPADGIWYLLYTSGTTGTPKAVIYTFTMAMVNYINISQPIGLTARDTTLNFLPLFHTAGINLHTLPTLIIGGRVLIMPGFDVDVMLDLVAAGRVDAIFGVPAIYQMLSLHPRFASVDLTRLRSWGCGGAPLSDQLVQRFLERGVRVCNGMGMTETGPTAFIMDPNRVAEKIGSVGKPQVLSGVRIVGPDGVDVKPGEAGELWFGGPGITPGYWNRPEATAAAFSADGWLKSGDLARCDADGFYYVVGRIKEMYISGGENVYPAEVENVLSQHPAILEAAVVGVPDEKWGEVGCAHILPRPGQTMPATDELTLFCRERLAPFKVPKSFVMVTDFPRTAAGKVQKHRLQH